MVEVHEPTFQTTQGIGIPVLARDRFVDPTRITKQRRVLLVRGVERHEGVEVVDLWRQGGI